MFEILLTLSKFILPVRYKKLIGTPRRTKCQQAISLVNAKVYSWRRLPIRCLSPVRDNAYRKAFSFVRHLKKQFLMLQTYRSYLVILKKITSLKRKTTSIQFNLYLVWENQKWRPFRLKSEVFNIFFLTAKL